MRTAEADGCGHPPSRRSVSAVAPAFGVGFRSPHFDAIVAAPRAVDWLEIIADTHFAAGGPRRARLSRLRADHPIAMHGVSLSIAGDEPLPGPYLRALRALADWLEPVQVSDHLCWTGLGGHQSHDLLPIAYTEEVLDHVTARVARVQEVLGRRVLLENPTAYVAFRDDEMDEAHFFAELSRRTGCGMLLDVNNLYVNAVNLGTDPARYLASLPDGIVGYMHLAGHAVLADVRIDTHDADVPAPVWALFDAAVRRFPDAGVVIERDDDLPPFARLVEEVEWARQRHRAATGMDEPVPVDAARRRPTTVRRWEVLRREFWSQLVDQPRGFDRPADLGALLDDDRPVPAARGMRVYSDSYTVSLRRALATNFPTLARIISADDFDRLAAAYLRRYPPAGHGFRGLGAALAGFVRTYPFAHDYGVEAGALAEIVALEQAQLDVLDEPDEPAGVTPASLAAIAPAEWPQARFTFSRALRIVRAAHDVHPVVEAVDHGDPPERPSAMDVAYLVCRADGRLHTEPLSPQAARILQALIGGCTFGTACAETAGDEARAATDGARALVLAARRGLLLRVSTATVSRSAPAQPAPLTAAGRPPAITSARSTWASPLDQRRIVRRLDEAGVAQQLQAAPVRRSGVP